MNYPRDPLAWSLLIGGGGGIRRLLSFGSLFTAAGNLGYTARKLQKLKTANVPRRATSFLEVRSIDQHRTQMRDSVFLRKVAEG